MDRHDRQVLKRMQAIEKLAAKLVKDAEVLVLLSALGHMVDECHSPKWGKALRQAYDTITAPEPEIK